MKKLPALVLAAALFAETGCDHHAPPVVDQPAPPPVQSSGVEIHSVLGAYLAARIATENGDTKSAADFYLAALKQDSDDVDLLQSALLTLLTEGRFADAIPVAQQELTYDSDAPWPLTLLGVEAAKRGDFSEARKQFAAIPHRSINGVLGPLLLAWSLAGNGLTDDALDALSPLAKFEGFKAVQAVHAGLILDQAGRTEQALTQFRIALAGPLNIRTIEAAGSAYQRLGRMDEARALYKRYQTEHPETLLFNGESLLAQGKSIAPLAPDAQTGIAAVFFDVSQLLRQDDSLPVSMIFNRLALYMQPDFPLAQMTAGDLLSTKGAFAEANAMYDSVAARSIVHFMAHLKLAQNLDEQGNLDQALDELTQLQAERPNTVELYIAKADMLRHHKNYAEAAIAYTQALQRFQGPEVETWALYFSRGACFERTHDWPHAEADFRWALSLNPDQPDVLNYLGYTWIDLGTNLPEALSMVQKAARLRPTDGAIIDSLGWVLFRLGDYAQAVPFLEKAVELKPFDSTINEHLGDAYWKTGRLNEARMQWRRAQSMEPEAEQLDGLNERNRTGQLPETTPGSK